MSKFVCVSTSGLLWHRLIGEGVLSIDTNASFLRAYAHLLKQKIGASPLLVNLSNTTEYRATVINANLDMGDSIQEEGSFVRGTKRTMSWFGSKASDGLRRERVSDGCNTMLLNVSPLELTDDGGIPSLDPACVSIESPISIAPVCCICYPPKL